ncbi:RidA family protein [Jatrophihabitans endophyticus]|nr:RidA family protein [Jatrophihabitans endophyticus]
MTSESADPAVPNPLARLAELGLTLPPVVAPLASYVPARRSGTLVFTAGQLPFVDGQLPSAGKVGAQVGPDEAQGLAAVAALNGLAAVHDAVGLDRVVGIVKVVGYVASAPDFTGQPAVVNGASDLLGSVFGPAAAHARSAVGVAALPLDAPVEIELIVEIAP